VCCGRSAIRRLTPSGADNAPGGWTAQPRLTGDRGGQYSIRINRQWRICFTWTDAGPEDVEIVDYH
jgi:plasmid maintenance system killer protein